MKPAIVTGASQGIGRAIAERLVNDGFYVIVADIDKEKGKAVANKLGSNSAEYHHCNVAKEQDVCDLFDYITEQFGKLDVMVNNAGIIKDNMIQNMPISDFEMVIDVNLKGAWHMSKKAAIIMRKQACGRIINISSRGWLGNFGQTNYAASKAGIIGLTRVLALELGKYNILVNAVAPGAINTTMVQDLPEKTRTKLINAQPTRTLGEPKDIAHVVSFLASKETNFITGQTIYVDGGKSIGANLT